MAFSRYSSTPRLDNNKYLGTSVTPSSIFFAVSRGTLLYTTRVVKGEERLDTIAGEVYGNSSYWWVIAAASGIGWNLQVPPGTLLKIPSDLGKVAKLAR